MTTYANEHTASIRRGTENDCRLIEVEGTTKSLLFFGHSVVFMH